MNQTAASSLLLTINLTAAAIAGWLCPVLTFPRADYKGVQGELLCYCLQLRYLIACYGGALQSHVLPCNINLDLERNLLLQRKVMQYCFRGGYDKWRLSVHNKEPSSWCKPRPNCFREIFHKRLCWKGALLPWPQSSTFLCALAIYLHLLCCNITPLRWFWVMMAQGCHA